MKEEFSEANWDKERWPNFSVKELRCSHTGEGWLDPVALDRLQGLRNKVGPRTITSAYRAPPHPIEAKKKDPDGNPRPGAHSTGKAFDVHCSGQKALAVVTAALADDEGLAFTGLGVKQSGSRDKRFIHLDCIEAEDNFHVPRPTIWSY